MITQCTRCGYRARSSLKWSQCTWWRSVIALLRRSFRWPTCPLRNVFFLESKSLPAFTSVPVLSMTALHSGLFIYCTLFWSCGLIYFKLFLSHFYEFTDFLHDLSCFSQGFFKFLSFFSSSSMHWHYLALPWSEHCSDSHLLRIWVGGWTGCQVCVRKSPKCTWTYFACDQLQSKWTTQWMNSLRNRPLLYSECSRCMLACKMKRMMLTILISLDSSVVSMRAVWVNFIPAWFRLHCLSHWS